VATSSTQENAFVEAAYKGELDSVRSLLKEAPHLARMPGVPAWEGHTPLSLAAGGGHLEIVRLLLAHGADLNPVSADGSALLMAAYGGRETTVALLLEHGADPNVASKSGETPLMAAAFKGLTQIGRMLIDAGAGLDARTTTGTTDFFNTSPPVCGESALHLAAAYGHREFVVLLLERGADKTIEDRCGQRPLHWAARHLRGELFALLK
jgi:ankyrin repeat protein